MSAFAKFYSISNDGIQKFKNKELNGVMISTLHQNLNVQNVQWAFTTIPNSVMDNEKLVSQLLTVISKPNRFQKDDVDVQSAFLKKYGEDVPEVITNCSISCFIQDIGRSWFWHQEVNSSYLSIKWSPLHFD